MTLIVIHRFNEPLKFYIFSNFAQFLTILNVFYSSNFEPLSYSIEWALGPNFENDICRRELFRRKYK